MLRSDFITLLQKRLIDKMHNISTLEKVEMLCPVRFFQKKKRNASRYVCRVWKVSINYRVFYLKEQIVNKIQRY